MQKPERFLFVIPQDPSSYHILVYRWDLNTGKLKPYHSSNSYGTYYPMTDKIHAVTWRKLVGKVVLPSDVDNYRFYFSVIGAVGIDRVFLYKPSIIHNSTYQRLGQSGVVAGVWDKTASTAYMQTLTSADVLSNIEPITTKFLFNLLPKGSGV